MRVSFGSTLVHLVLHSSIEVFMMDCRCREWLDERRRLQLSWQQAVRLDGRMVGWLDDWYV